MFLQQLRLLEGFDLAAMGHASAEYVHTVTECAKLAFADREAWYGDPEFADVPIGRRCCRREYADERRALVGDEASGELRPGRPADASRGCRRRSPARRVAPGVGEPTRGDTVHLDVVDRSGNMVAATPSGGWLWGAPVDSRARLLPRHARADVLARGGPAELARAGQAAAHDAVADARRARRRAVPRARHAGRRPAGPVDAATRSSGTCTSARTCRRRSTRPATTRRRSRARSIRARRARATSRSRIAPARRRSTGLREPRPRRRGVGAVVARPRERGRARARTAS